MHALFRRFRADTSSYLGRFNDAENRTRRLGLELPAFQACEGRVLESQDALEALSKAVSDTFAALSPELVACNCAPLTAALVGPVSEVLGCQACFTFGWFNLDGRNVYRMTERDIKRWLKGRLPSAGHANFHCWITLSTMEIVDATISTTDAIAKGRQIESAPIVTRYADEMTGLCYYPMLVGDHFLDRAGWVVSL